MKNFHQPPVETTFFSTATAKHRTETTTTTTTTTTKKKNTAFKKTSDGLFFTNPGGIAFQDLKLNFVKGEVSETALKEALATEAGKPMAEGLGLEGFPATKNPWKTRDFAALKKKNRFSGVFWKEFFFEWFQLVGVFFLFWIVFVWVILFTDSTVVNHHHLPPFRRFFGFFFQPSNMQILKLL